MGLPFPNILYGPFSRWNKSEINPTDLGSFHLACQSMWGQHVSAYTNLTLSRWMGFCFCFDINFYISDSINRWITDCDTTPQTSQTDQNKPLCWLLWSSYCCCLWFLFQIGHAAGSQDMKCRNCHLFKQNAQKTWLYQQYMEMSIKQQSSLNHTHIHTDRHTLNQRLFTSYLQIVWQYG